MKPIPKGPVLSKLHSDPGSSGNSHLHSWLYSLVVRSNQDVFLLDGKLSCFTVDTRRQIRSHALTNTEGDEGAEVKQRREDFSAGTVSSHYLSHGRAVIAELLA